jgi:HD-like signal output (HDOD) protein
MALPHPIVRKTSLASPSPIINRLIEMLFDPSTSLNDLAATLSTDAALSARALGAANAAFSSPKNRIDNVHDAVIRIGLIPLIHIITVSEIKAVFLSVPGKYGDMKQLWIHNLVTACIADAYAQHLHLEKPARWFTGGLLHDIGRLLLLTHDPVKYAEVVTRIDSGGQSVCDAEREVYGISHQYLGHQLMTLWHLPEEIAEAAFHHQHPFVA